MIIVGFIESNGYTYSSNLFNEICIKNKLISSSNIESNADIIIINLNYKYLLSKQYNFIKFDILIFENCDIIKLDSEANILNNIHKKSIIITNLDDKRIFKFLRGTNIKLITYGLNCKSCITTSSIQNDNYMLQELECCIQRTIPTFKNKMIEPQEFKVVLQKYKNNNIHSSLAAISAALMCGIETKGFEKLVL